MKNKETVWILMYIGTMGDHCEIKAVFKKRPSFKKYCELTNKKDISLIVERDDAETIIAGMLREMNGSVSDGYILSKEEIVAHHKEESE